MQNICVFDIETVPDTAAFAKLNGVEGLSQAEQFQLMQQQRRGEVGHDFMRHHLHRIVAISVCVYIGDKHKVATLGEVEDDEETLVEKFFNLIETYQPVLVSWNGSGFDLPVLHYRALFHGVSAPAYWDVGHFDGQRKWANYMGRFQWQHIDVMDVIAGYQGGCRAPLNDVAKLCGFPGKLATDGSAVLDLYRDGNVTAIRDYCETDVLNTYLVYLRFELMRGLLLPDAYETRVAHLRNYVSAQKKTHFDEFLAAWAA